MSTDLIYNKISSSDLIGFILYNLSPIENYTITGKCILNQLIEPRHPLEIKNCAWEDVLIIKNTNFNQPISFINCRFDKGILFNNNEFNGKLIFESCTITQEIIISDVSFAEVNFNNTQIQELYITGIIKNSGIKNNPIAVTNSIFNKLCIEDANLHKHFKLVSGAVNDLRLITTNVYASFAIGSWENDSFSIKDSYLGSSKFYHRVDFLNGYIENRFGIHKVEFKEQVVFRKEFSSNYIDFTEVKASHNVSFTFNDNIDYLDFKDCWFDTSFSLNCYQQNSFTKRPSITFDGIINGNYIIEDIDTLSINISCINFGNIMFHNVSTKFIWLNKFFNYNKLFFNNIKRHPNYAVLIIFDSSVGNTEFVNIDFRKFDEVVIAKSDVSSILLSNSLLPKKIQIKTKDPRIGVEVGEFDKINDNMYYRETYRQLKLAMEKLGNRYYSLVYKSNEMHYQRKELKFSWDKILLYVNYYTNNYGINWVRGITFTLSCALISFILLNAVTSHPIFHWSTNLSWSDFGIIWTHFIKYISTFPVLKNEMQDENNWLIDSILLLARIFIGVGIYQTITAFRKYGK